MGSCLGIVERIDAALYSDRSDDGSRERATTAAMNHDDDAWGSWRAVVAGGDGGVLGAGCVVVDGESRGRSSGRRKLGVAGGCWSRWPELELRKRGRWWPATRLRRGWSSGLSGDEEADEIWSEAGVVGGEESWWRGTGRWRACKWGRRTALAVLAEPRGAVGGGGSWDRVWRGERKRTGRWVAAAGGLPAGGGVGRRRRPRREGRRRKWARVGFAGENEGGREKVGGG